MTPDPMTSHLETAPSGDAAGTETSQVQALNARRAAILEAVVTEYIGTAEPVGSSHVARTRRPGLLGHRPLRDGGSRAGRLSRPAPHERRAHPDRQGVPLLRGPPDAPGCSGRRSVARSPSSSSRCTVRWRPCSSGASGLLSELTSYAAVVVGPSHETATVRSVQVVGLSPQHALLVVVLSDGAVEKRTIDLDAEVSVEDFPRPGPPWRRSGGHDARRTLVRPRQRVGCRGPGGRRCLRGAGVVRGLAGRRPGLRRRTCSSGRFVRRRRDGALGAGDTGAAVGRGLVAARRARPGPLGVDRDRARVRAFVVVRRGRRPGAGGRTGPGRRRSARPHAHGLFEGAGRCPRGR